MAEKWRRCAAIARATAGLMRATAITILDRKARKSFCERIQSMGLVYLALNLGCESGE
jgi:hypothetical protein